MSSGEENSSAPEDDQRELSVYERRLLLKKSKKMRPDTEQQEEEEDGGEPQVSAASASNDTLPPRGKYINKHRVLIFSSRGIPHRYRHLMNDLRRLLPHSKKENKLDPRATLAQINEIAEIKSCDACIFFEVRKKQDLYLWFSKTPNGPSVKFFAHNVHTMDELNMTGNCMLGSRPLLHFDAAFDTAPHFSLLKEIFTQMFGVPNNHPKAKPFVDHILGFYILDNRIWLRNYQIVEKAGAKGKSSEMSLVEIGPRVVLNPIKVFAGSFGGATLWENPFYVSPNQVRKTQYLEKAGKYKQRKITDEEQKERKKQRVVEPDELDELFHD
eukprot:Mycagemm_TRINITY_DN10387_c0_g5::TRINITY_DN10387_c0_g5_i1::g.487::m.487 type:complete len:327 gc:universal TRINITY_DN10387_c0_g5_i1:103-1083(+)